MTRFHLRAILLGASIAFILPGCVGDAAGPAQADPHDDLAPDDHDRAPPSALGPADVVLEAHAGMPDADLEIHPNPLRVPLGSVVEIRVANAGSTPHTFTIHTFDADTGMMEPGEERTIRFLADKAGSFEVMCDAPGHYAAGMRSDLDVAA